MGGIPPHWQIPIQRMRQSLERGHLISGSVRYMFRRCTQGARQEDPGNRTRRTLLEPTEGVASGACKRGAATLLALEESISRGS